jgi:hypothetical protein
MRKWKLSYVLVILILMAITQRKFGRFQGIPGWTGNLPDTFGIIWCQRKGLKRGGPAYLRIVIWRSKWLSGHRPVSTYTWACRSAHRYLDQWYQRGDLAACSQYAKGLGGLVPKGISYGRMVTGTPNISLLHRTQRRRVSERSNVERSGKGMCREIEKACSGL